MNGPSISKIIHINFDEQDIPHQMNVAGNQGQQGQVANVQSAHRRANINWQNAQQSAPTPACQNWKQDRQQPNQQQQNQVDIQLL